jgi:hypothetical protein
MASQRRWTPDELLLAFRLYCRTPFGRLHQRNPEIIELAGRIDRTPSAVAMKACNFASLDPVQQARGIAALGNVSRDDRDLWERFLANPDAVAVGIEEAAERTLAGSVAAETESGATEIQLPDGSSEVERLVRTRRIQSFFRAAVLASYGGECAVTGISVRGLLNASHIIPWSRDERRRADPRNGICLNALYDRAFDRGLITFDERFRLVVAAALKSGHVPPFQRQAFESMEGATLRSPERFPPDPQALAYHRENVFQRGAA